MDNLSMIACVGKNLELGKNNDLIWHLPNDLKYFKSVTKGKTVTMGRRTFESLPGILPKRRNIVLQLPNESKLDGVEIFNKSNEPFFRGLEYFEKNNKFNPIVALTCNGEKFVLIEGHSRMTVYGMKPQLFIVTFGYIGYCSKEDMEKYDSRMI